MRSLLDSNLDIPRDKELRETASQRNRRHEEPSEVSSNIHMASVNHVLDLPK